jgi:ligand-binding sensor domain-containing protein
MIMECYLERTGSPELCSGRKKGPDFFLKRFKEINTRFIVILLILLTAMVLPANMFAQKDNVRFERISLEHGLSQVTVYSIIQDSQGFMWFGTQDGLNKYDGYNFTVYRHDPENRASLSHNYVISIFEDSGGSL